MVKEKTISVNGIEIAASQLDYILAQVLQTPLICLQTPWIRKRLAAERLDELSTKDIRRHDADAPDFSISPKSYCRNFREFLSPDRMERLIAPLRSIDLIFFEASKMRLLSVGPIEESALLTYLGMGFAPGNFRGLDLVSSSSAVDAGDMHRMPYGDALFNIVVLGWALSLTKNPRRVAEETLRVGIPGGYVAIGAERAPKKSRKRGRAYFESTEEILNLFGRHVERVFFRHDPPVDGRSESGDLMVIFKTRRRPAFPSGTLPSPNLDWTVSRKALEGICDEIRRDPSLVMQIPWARKEISASRLKELKDEGIRTFRDHRKTVARNVVDYNIDSMRQNLNLDRVDRLIDPLASIAAIRDNVARLKILTVGPRTEAELFSLMGVGFLPENIRGLDLISYNPLVDLGDMHDMPYADGAFNVVVVGWTLTYSTDVQRVANEIARVAKPGGYVAIAVNSTPGTREEKMAAEGKDFLDATYYRHTKEILDRFEGRIAELVFHHDLDTTVQTAGDLMVIFRLN